MIIVSAIALNKIEPTRFSEAKAQRSLKHTQLDTILLGENNDK